MKKLIAFCLSLFIFAPVLSGCAGRKSDTDDKSSVSDETNSENTDGTVSEETGNESSVPKKESVWINSKTVIDSNDSLYKLNCGIADSFSIGEIMMFGDCLLLSASDCFGEESKQGSNKIFLIDIYSGKLKAETEFPIPDDIKVRTGKNRILLLDSENSTVYILDENLSLTEKQTVSSKDCVLMADSSCRYIYSFPLSENSCVTKTDLDTGKTSEIFTEFLRFSLFGKQKGNFVPVSFLDGKTFRNHFACLDLSTGELTEPPAQNQISSVEFSKNNCLISDLSRNYIFCNEKGVMYSLPDHTDSYFLADGPINLYSVQYPKAEAENIKYTFYKEDGTFLTSCFFSPDGCLLTDPVWCPEANGYFIVFMKSGGQNSLLFLDASKNSNGKPLEMKAISDNSAKKPSEIPQDLFDRAQSLSEKYGVKIFLGSLCETTFPDFSAETVSDTETIEKAMITLETVLRSYPKNFFPQLLYDKYHEFRIMLVGHLTADKDQSGNSFYQGIALHENNMHTIAVDITQDFKQVMYHEISHITDERLAFVSDFKNTSYSENAWAALNPKDFAYSGSQYIIPDGNDGYNSYFVDSYARTLPTEDRARVMENAMIGNNYYFDKENYPHLREKLAFYSKCIRECFDTAGWDEITQWEKPLF